MDLWTTLDKDHSYQPWHHFERTHEVIFDNQAAINIAHNPVHHDLTKHVEIDWYFIKEKLDSGLICTPPYMPSSKQLVDILTKGLPSSTFYTILDKIRMQNIFAPAWGGVLEE